MLVALLTPVLEQAPRTVPNSQHSASLSIATHAIVRPLNDFKGSESTITLSLFFVSVMTYNMDMVITTVTIADIKLSENYLLKVRFKKSIRVV